MDEHRFGRVGVETDVADDELASEYQDGLHDGRHDRRGLGEARRPSWRSAACESQCPCAASCFAVTGSIPQIVRSNSLSQPSTRALDRLPHGLTLVFDDRTCVADELAVENPVE